MSDNMTLYNAVRTPPPEALKAITGGRLKGMTDINPMWRIKTMTAALPPRYWSIMHFSPVRSPAE